MFDEFKEKLKTGVGSLRVSRSWPKRTSQRGCQVKDCLMTVLETCVIISKKVKSSNTLKEKTKQPKTPPSICSAYPIQGYAGIGGYPSYDGMRGIVHPEHVSNVTQKQTMLSGLLPDHRVGHLKNCFKLEMATTKPAYLSM